MGKHFYALRLQHLHVFICKENHYIIIYQQYTLLEKFSEINGGKDATCWRCGEEKHNFVNIRWDY